MGQQPRADETFDLFADLKLCSIKQDSQWGRILQAKTVYTQNDSSMYVLSALISMYGKCGNMVEARTVFDTDPKPDVVSWTALLSGYAENGEGKLALEVYSGMKINGCSPNSLTYVAVLKACTSLAINGDRIECLKQGRNIHLEIGVHMNQYVEGTLIDMYGRSGSMTDAQVVFDTMRRPDVVSWTALILGYAENGEPLVAMDLFSKMKAAKCELDSRTYVAALKACTSLAENGGLSGKKECLKRGKAIHLELGRNLNNYVLNTLVDMYGKCGSMADALIIFQSIKKPDIVSWNALLLGYAENGDVHLAMDVFTRIKARGFVPNAQTYVAALKACTSLVANGDENGKKSCLEWVRQIHLEIGSHLNHYIEATLISMYAKCGSLIEAHSLFDNLEKPDVVSWNTLLWGYVESGKGHSALDLFSRMKVQGYIPDSVTYLAALKSCASLAVSGDGSGKGDCLEQVRELHLDVGCHLNQYVQSTLIDMYAKCGSMVEARTVFDTVQHPDLVSWNALLLGYAENGEGRIVLDLFTRMKSSGCAPDSVTYLAALKACGIVGALGLGRKFHLEVRELSPHVVSCLVDFYAKCGSLIEARQVFESYPRARDVTTWTALLAGYGSLGDSESVFSLFEAMQDEGLQPDLVTFVCLLLCCSHCGHKEKARVYFEAMSHQFGLEPTVAHYNCMVDVLGRANQLNEAINLVRKMHCKADYVTWMSLLGACGKWKNVEIGRLAFQSLVGFSQRAASAHVLMAQIYGSIGMLEEQKTILEATRSFELVEGSG